LKQAIDEIRVVRAGDIFMLDILVSKRKHKPSSLKRGNHLETHAHYSTLMPLRNMIVKQVFQLCIAAMYKTIRQANDLYVGFCLIFAAVRAPSREECVLAHASKRIDRE
jgi:hypothetical protein